MNDRTKKILEAMGAETDLKVVHGLAEMLVFSVYFSIQSDKSIAKPKNANKSGSFDRSYDILVHYLRLRKEKLQREEKCKSNTSKCIELRQR